LIVINEIVNFPRSVLHSFHCPATILIFGRQFSKNIGSYFWWTATEIGQHFLNLGKTKKSSIYQLSTCSKMIEQLVGTEYILFSSLQIKICFILTENVFNTEW